MSDSVAAQGKLPTNSLFSILSFVLLGLHTPHCPFPTFGFRFAVLTTVNSPDYCGACLLLWLFSETNLTAFKSVKQGFGKFIHNRGVPLALR
jgi:hypothetical protein